MLPTPYEIDTTTQQIQERIQNFQGSCIAGYEYDCGYAACARELLPIILSLQQQLLRRHNRSNFIAS